MDFNVLSLNQSLIDFIHHSPTPFHAVSNICSRLQEQGFQSLDEKQPWQLTQGQGYFVTRNDSSIVAFYHADQSMADHGIRMIGAHTDSPCLKVKPNAELFRSGYVQLGVEVYGGVLLNPWFDRELGLAGKVSFTDTQGQIQHQLINLNQPIGMIPSLAIHLDRTANKDRSINPQTDIPVVLSVNQNNVFSFKDFLAETINTNLTGPLCAKVLDYELSFYDINKGSIFGLDNDFIASSRLDNLLSCCVGLEAFLASGNEQHKLFVFNDHEEVGSQSAVGAAGPFLKDVLTRIAGSNETFIQAMQNSFMISIDNAHALHPNYANKHDLQHGPLINHGPVIKINANQRYASNSESQALFRWLCEQENIPVQSFVVRSDMACGSTIGPITAAELGVRTLDLGVPTWGMHSIRETCGTQDCDHLFKALARYFGLQASHFS